MNTFHIFILTLVIAASSAGCGEPEVKKGGTLEVNNGLDPNGNNNNPGSKPDDKPKDDSGDYPFANAPEKALAGIETISYKCFFPGYETAHRIRLSVGGNLSVDDFEGGESPGSWERFGDSIAISIPDLGFSETTNSVAIDLDVVATLFFPSTICGALRVNDQPDTSSQVLFCDSHEYIPQTLIENSEFYFWNSGYVKRRRWEKLLAIPDEIYSVRDGIWKEVNGIVYVVFPTGTGEDSDSIRYLTMTAKSDGLSVKEFGNPDACMWE